jgi:sugar phosphate isomerase/epimerase
MRLARQLSSRPFGDARSTMIGGLSRRGDQEEFDFWARQRADFIMLSVAYDFFLDQSNVARITELHRASGLDVLIHPRPDGHTLLSPANPCAHSLLFEAFGAISQLVTTLSLIPKIIVHLSTYRIPGTDYPAFSEEEAITHTRSFYEGMQSFGNLSLVLENVYPPGIGWEELGYKAAHFRMFSLPANSEFCLDTGHLMLSQMTVADILTLPFPLTCLHLHANDGKSDLHKLLTRRDFPEWSELEGLLGADRYIVLEVKGTTEGLAHALNGLRHNRLPP